jgi:hypothetical protein
VTKPSSGSVQNRSQEEDIDCGWLPGRNGAETARRLAGCLQRLIDIAAGAPGQAMGPRERGPIDSAPEIIRG